MRGAPLHYAASIGDSSQAFMSPSGSVPDRRLRALVLSVGPQHHVEVIRAARAELRWDRPLRGEQVAESATGTTSCWQILALVITEGGEYKCSWTFSGSSTTYRVQIGGS